MNQTSHKPTFENWDVSYYTEETNVDNETRIYALFERHEDRRTFVVFPDKSVDLRDNEFKTNIKHKCVLIFPSYYSYLPDVWTDIKEVKEWTGRVFSPHVSWNRSSLGQFDWDQVPDNMTYVSTYKDKFPLAYGELIDNIETHSTLSQILKHEPGLVEDPYPVDLSLHRFEDGEEVILTMRPHMSDNIKDIVKPIVNEDTVSESVLNNLDGGEYEKVGNLYVTRDESWTWRLGPKWISLEPEKFNNNDLEQALAESEFYSNE